MDSLDKLQEEIHTWRQKNFPKGEDIDMLLGLGEEVGELDHQHLKMKQGIRMTSLQEMRDAIGDAAIFLMGYCSYRGMKFSHCIEEAWEVVRERDWVLYPKNGRTE